MNALSEVKNKATMSSLELVKIINDLREEGQAELRHTDFTAKVRKVLGDEGAKFSAPFKKASGQTAQGYLFPKREATLMVMSESYKVQAAVYDRLDDLESKQYKLPTNYLEALTALVQSETEKQTLQLKIDTDKPKVEFAEAVRRLEGSCSIGDFSKVIEYGQNRLFAKLRNDGFLMANNRLYQSAIDRGLLTSIEQTPYTDSKGVSHPAFKTLITGKGQVYFEKRYRTEEIA